MRVHGFTDHVTKKGEIKKVELLWTYVSTLYFKVPPSVLTLEFLDFLKVFRREFFNESSIWRIQSEFHTSTFTEMSHVTILYCDVILKLCEGKVIPDVRD